MNTEIKWKQWGQKLQAIFKKMYKGIYERKHVLQTPVCKWQAKKHIEKMTQLALHQ